MKKKTEASVFLVLEKKEGGGKAKGNEKKREEEKQKEIKKKEKHRYFSHCNVCVFLEAFKKLLFVFLPPSCFPMREILMPCRVYLVPRVFSSFFISFWFCSLLLFF